MPKRQKKFILLAIICLSITIAIGFLGSEGWLRLPSRGNRVHIVMDNRTDQPLGPYVLMDYQDSATVQINRIEPLSKTEVKYITPKTWGENGILMKDQSGNEYPVVGYFENSIRGRVDIRIECVSSAGLSGKRREFISYFPSLDWYGFGSTACD